MEVEQQKLDEIATVSNSMLELKIQQSTLHQEKIVQLQTNCDRLKKMRLEEYDKTSKELDEKEKELCRKTNQLVQELVSTCDDTPFHKALIKILGNLKGK